MYYYQSGSLIFDSEFVSGNMSYSDRQTHAGIFTFIFQDKSFVSPGRQKIRMETYEYEEPVDYWSPLTAVLDSMMLPGEMRSEEIFI